MPDDLVANPQVHVYPLSRLVHATAGKWKRVIEEIESGKAKAFAYYLPMREAVVLWCEKGGKETDVIVSDLLARAREMGGARGEAIAKDNEAAFRMFVDVFAPQIKKFNRAFLRDAQAGIEFEGVLLTGTPHLEVIDHEGNQRFVFLHAADWKAADLKAYLELLGVIIERKYGAEPEAIWCMDLRTGKTIKFKRGKLMRRRCADAARLYSRFVRSAASES